jgi:hypothetical protein
MEGEVKETKNEEGKQWRKVDERDDLDDPMAATKLINPLSQLSMLFSRVGYF